MTGAENDSAGPVPDQCRFGAGSVPAYVSYLCRSEIRNSDTHCAKGKLKN